MPLPSNLTGVAGADLGIGLGDSLRGQTADESEEEKRKRRLGMSPLAAGSQSVMSLYPGLSTGVPGVGGGGVRGGRGY